MKATFTRENPCICPCIGRRELLDELEVPVRRSTASFAEIGSPLSAHRKPHRLLRTCISQIAPMLGAKTKAPAFLLGLLGLVEA